MTANRPPTLARLAGIGLRWRLLAAVVALALAVAAATGLVGMQAAGRVIERRQVETSVAQAARLVEELHLPPSELMLKRLRQILGGEFVVVAADGRLLATTLHGAARAAWLARPPAAIPAAGSLRLAGIRHRLARAPLRADKGGAAALVMLLPHDATLPARREAVWWILAATGLAGALALGGGWRLAARVAAPVENLAASLRRLAAGVAAGQEPAAAAAAVPPATAAAPPELRQLQEAFTILGRELAESRRQLTRAVQLAAVGRLAAVVVHEIRNPLSGIKMNAQILAGAGPAPADPSLTHILREIDRLDLFLQELLALAQGADAGPVPAAGVPAAERPAAGDAGEVAQAVLATLRPKLERAGVAVTTAFPNPCRVAADERRLRQIWLNLILNALDAMPQGGQLQLGAAPDPADARRWRCELRDSGPGVHLPPGQEPFAAFVTGKPHGTGLGLFVCARLAESLGGAIGYENPPGGGARFWFTLPRG